MENVFEEILAQSTEALEEPDTDAQEEGDYDHSFDLDVESLADDENIEIEEGEEAPSGDAKEVGDNPTNAAFAQMRTQNKELQTKLNELDAIAKAAGLKDYNELIAKGKEAQVKKEAKKQGIPIELAKEIQEMRDLKESIIQEKNNADLQQKQNVFVSNVNDFIKTNNLSATAVEQLSQDLEKDGLEIDTLMGMSKGALNRILSAYTDVNYQKNLERKDTIRKEMPINQTSKIDAKALNKDIDDLAKQLAGKI